MLRSFIAVARLHFDEEKSEYSVLQFVAIIATEHFELIL
jgi:hypothetical protein